MKKTKCARCGQVGHWAANCKNEPDAKGKAALAAKGHNHLVVEDQPVEIPNVMLAVADGVGLESVTHQTSSVGFCLMAKDVPPQDSLSPCQCRRIRTTVRRFDG